MSCPLGGRAEKICNGVSRIELGSKRIYPAWLGRTLRRWVIAGGARSTGAEPNQLEAEGKTFPSAYGTRSRETRERRHTGLLWVYYLFNMWFRFSSSDAFQEGRSSGFVGTALADTNGSPGTELCSCRVLCRRVGFLG